MAVEDRKMIEAYRIPGEQGKSRPQKDNEGNMLALDFTIEENNITLVNIY